MKFLALMGPLMLAGMFLELAYSTLFRKGLYNFQDFVTNVGLDVGGKMIYFAMAILVFNYYTWWAGFIPWEIPDTWYTWAILFVLSDFVFYWFHRANHSINILWALHITHHSSEEYNLSMGGRGNALTRVPQFLVFNWVLVLMGFSPEAIYIVAFIHLFVGYFQHTQVIKKLGWFEKWMVTPSHHRVHHGLNPQYIDKNYSEVFIIWDKLFGSFEPEHEKVVYGITKPPRTWDPVYMYFQHFIEIWEQARMTLRWWDKLRIWFMPLGWVPPGVDPAVRERGKVGIDRPKYKSRPFRRVGPYLMVQLILGIGVGLFASSRELDLGVEDRIALGILIGFMVINWGGLLESRSWATQREMLRNFLMATALILILHWNGIADWTSGWTGLIGTVAGANILYLALVVKRDRQRPRPVAETVQSQI